MPRVHELRLIFDPIALFFLLCRQRSRLSKRGLFIRSVQSLSTLRSMLHLAPGHHTQAAPVTGDSFQAFADANRKTDPLTFLFA